MILSMSSQALLFLLTVCIGLFSGFVYDIFRILRTYIKHKDFVTHLEDIFYWLFVSCVMFYIFLNENYGEIRFFCILGVALGMVIYFFAVSRFVLMVSNAVIGFVAKVLTVIFNIISFPFKLFYKLFKKPILFLKSQIVNFLKFLKKVLINIKNYAKMKGKAAAKDIDIILKKV